MPRPHGGFGSRYRCPDCGINVDSRQGYKRYGPWSAHKGCTVTCALCQRPIEEPAIGKGHTIAAWCGEPVHTSCKENQP